MRTSIDALPRPGLRGRGPAGPAQARGGTPRVTFFHRSRSSAAAARRPPRLVGGLPRQLAPAVEPALRELPAVDGRPDRAARLPLVVAVGEAARARRAPPRPRTWCRARRRRRRRPTPRSPGVSTSTAPPASGTSSRCVVVCRPRPSARRSPVAMTSRPASALTRLDLPAPDGPTATSVAPGASSARRPSSPRPVSTLTAWTSTPRATATTSAAMPSGSGTRSALVRTTTGVAPERHASVSSRSTRPRSGSGSRCSTTSTTSTLAASACTREVAPALSRTRAVVRDAGRCRTRGGAASHRPSARAAPRRRSPPDRPGRASPGAARGYRPTRPRAARGPHPCRHGPRGGGRSRPRR